VAGTGTDYPRRGDRPPWSWQGATALVLAVCVGGGWLAGVVLAALEATDELDGRLASLLNGIGQVLAGALGTYLGFAAGTQRADRPPPGPPPPGGNLAPGAGADTEKG
jgi:hypothetical protein